MAKSPKKVEQDDPAEVEARAKRITQRMLNTPPRPHKDEPKRGKGKDTKG